MNPLQEYPYRWLCTNCNSVSLQRKLKNRRRNGKGRNENLWYCVQCHQYNREAYDKLKGHNVAPEQI